MENARPCCRAGREEQASTSPSILLGLGMTGWLEHPQAPVAGLVNQGLLCFQGWLD